MQFSAPRGAAYIVEASTTLVDWEKIAAGTVPAPGEYDFEDAQAAQFPSRFYRIVSP